MPTDIPVEMIHADIQILIVDDMSTMRKIVSKCLRELGLNSLDKAANGNEAWNKLEQSHKTAQPIQLVISDWNMPELSGLDLLKKIRASKEFATVPFLMVSAESEKAQIADARTAGVDGYLTKPFSSEELKAALEEVLKKRPL